MILLITLIRRTDVPENSYRYVDLVLNNPIGSFSSDLSITRGDVSPKLFNKNCPSSFTNSSSFIHSDLLKSENVGNDCNMGQLAIDSSSGRILKAEVSDEYNPFTNPERTLNPPSVAATDYTSAVQKLKFKTPAIIDNLDKKDPYILVIDLDFSKKTKVSYSTFL